LCVIYFFFLSLSQSLGLSDAIRFLIGRPHCVYVVLVEDGDEMKLYVFVMEHCVLIDVVFIL